MEPIAGIVDSLRENTTLRNSESFVDTVARIAEQNPELRAQANEAIAEATRNLSPSQRGAILERIGNDAALGGENAASQLAEAMGNNSVPDTGQQLNSKTTQPAPAEPEAPQLGDSPTGKPGNFVSTIDEAASNAIGVGELGAEAGIVRQGLNTVGGGAATVVGTALTAKQLGQNIGEYAEGISRGMDSNTTDREANQAFQQSQNAANNTAILGTLGAAAAASPVIVGGTLTGIGAYQGTRYIMENTETGKAIEAAKLNGLDGVIRGGEAASEGIKGALGVETQQQRDQNQLDALRAAFERALGRGDISIKDGHTKEELMELLSHTDASNFQASLAAVVERHPAKSDTTDKDNSDASKSQNAKAPADADDSAASEEDTTEDNSGATEPDNTQEPADVASSATDEDNNAAAEPDTTEEPANEDTGGAAEPDTTEDNSGASEPDNSDQSTDNSGANGGGSDDSDCGCGDADNSGAAEPDTAQEPADVDNSATDEDNSAAAEPDNAQEPAGEDSSATDEDNSAAAEPDTTEDDSGATESDDTDEVTCGLVHIGACAR
jgi:hypothetical protein